MLHVHSFFVSAFCALLLVANYSGDAYEPIALTRRRALLSTLAPSIVALAGCDVMVVPAPANGVTQIPEFKYQKSYLASVLLNTFDQATHESTVDFFTNAFIGCELRREEKVRKEKEKPKRMRTLTVHKPPVYPKSRTRTAASLLFWALETTSSRYRRTSALAYRLTSTTAATPT